MDVCTHKPQILSQRGNETFSTDQENLGKSSKKKKKKKKLEIQLHTSSVNIEKFQILFSNFKSSAASNINQLDNEIRKIKDFAWFQAERTWKRSRLTAIVVLVLFNIQNLAQSYTA